MLNVLTIFDCDGVLVDSEALAAQVFSEQLKEYGIHLTTVQCLAKFKGLTLSDCTRLVETEFSCQLAPRFLADLKCATQQRFHHSLQPVEGVENVLSWMKTYGGSICVASNGGVDKIRHSLTVTGLTRYFEHIFSADQVARGKPAPDLFLLAADSLGFASNECVVIEDSPSGLAAAHAANMQVLFYSEDGFGCDEQAPAFSRMEQLPGLLKKIWGHEA